MQQRRARDWVCDCGAYCLGTSYECFNCESEKPAGARAAMRQVTDAADAGPAPKLAPMSQADLYIASTDAATTVQTTRPAAYYAAAAAKNGSFQPQTFRTAALNAALPGIGADKGSQRKLKTERARNAAPGATHGEHRAAIEQLKAEQVARREVAEAQKTEERRERERRREERALQYQVPPSVVPVTDAGADNPEANETRIDPGDGNTYTLEQFREYYDFDEASAQWEAAAPLRSDC